MGLNAGHILEGRRHFISERSYGRKGGSLAYVEAGHARDLLRRQESRVRRS